MMARNVVCWFILCSSVLLFSLVSAKKIHGNPANDIVNILNQNRTSQKLQKLNDNAGLGCIALQYIESCNGTCTINDTINCNISEDDFTEVFAPNCGVELATFGTLSGRILGCQSEHSRKPSQTFSNSLVRDKKTLSLVKDKRHKEVGVGLVRTHKGSFLWCVLLSSDKTNSTFVLEGGGRGIKQTRGCFSGTDIPCSHGERVDLVWNIILTVASSVLVSYIHNVA